MLFLRLKNDDDESSFEPYMDSSHDLVDWSHQFHEGVYCMSTRYYGRGTRNAVVGECFEEIVQDTLGSYWNPLSDGKYLQVLWNHVVIGEVFVPLEPDWVDQEAFPYPLMRLPEPIGMGPFDLLGVQFRDIRSTNKYEICAVHFRIQ